jgi:molecular chaperone HtpG
MTTETHSFQAEVQQLLELMVHSLYSQKDIFLRELISNASDALNKQSFAELTCHDLLKSDSPLSITLSVFPESRRIVIEDNGIGMTKEELMENLGTIARSGTRRFLEQMSSDQKKGFTPLLWFLKKSSWNLAQVQGQRLMLGNRRVMGNTHYLKVQNLHGGHA